jgi:hypothetical protein
LKSYALGIYSERRFLIKELSQFTIAVGYAGKIGGFGLMAKYFGYSDFNQSQLGIAYGKNLGKIDLGVQFNYRMITISQYGKANVLTCEMGMIWHLTDNVHAGLAISNPFGGKIGENGNEKLSRSFTSGFGYEASEQVFISTEIIKEEDRPVNVKAGLQYVFAGKFFIRVGIATVATQPFAGAGWRWKNFRIDVFTTYHPQLGYTPGLLLIYQGNSNEQ